MFHLYVTYIRSPPSADLPMLIPHYTSADLITWGTTGRWLSSELVIDACVVKRPEGGFRMRFKDGTDGSTTWSADSDDLYACTVTGRVLSTEGGHEGPHVFFFDGWWLLVDTWGRSGRPPLTRPDRLGGSRHDPRQRTASFSPAPTTSGQACTPTWSWRAAGPGSSTSPTRTA